MRNWIICRIFNILINFKPVIFRKFYLFFYPSLSLLSRFLSLSSFRIVSLFLLWYLHVCVKCVNVHKCTLWRRKDFTGLWSNVVISETHSTPWYDFFAIRMKITFYCEKKVKRCEQKKNYITGRSRQLMSTDNCMLY